MDIVGICGSLRAQSFNHMALRLAGECMPNGMALSIVDWSALPPFNADAMEQSFPPAVTTLCDRIRLADGVLIATPEYNFSVPGMLKNAIDWISRVKEQPLAEKPLAILSAATGPLGGARVQYDLRKTMLFLNAQVLVKPEVFIGGASQKFNAQGQCSDESTRQFVTLQMQAFQRWIERQNSLEAKRP